MDARGVHLLGLDGGVTAGGHDDVAAFRACRTMKADHGLILLPSHQ